MPQLIPQEIIESKIFFVRGKKVMLDRDLAVLYGVDTRSLNQTVRRNIDRFPDDFIFVLTRREILNLSQNVISSTIKHAPNVFAFTEQGVAMLSGLLKSKKAVQVNILIMRAFVRLRQILISHHALKHKIEDIERRLGSHDNQIKLAFEALRKLLAPPEKPRRKFGFHSE